MNEASGQLAWLSERIQLAPFHRWLGLRVEELESGTATLALPFDEELLTAAGYIHGGAIATLIDTAGDWAVATMHGRTVPTIDLRVDYLRTAHAGEDLLARAEVARYGRAISIADMRVTQGSERVVALGRGAYATLDTQATDGGTGGSIGAASQ